MKAEKLIELLKKISSDEEVVDSWGESVTGVELVYDVESEERFARLKRGDDVES